MFNLVRTILGVLFFTFTFGIVLIKNHPAKFEFFYEQPLKHKSISYTDYLKSSKAKESWRKNILAKSHLIYSTPNNLELKVAQKSVNELDFIFSLDNNITLKETWLFSPNEKLVQIRHVFDVDFLGKLLLLRYPQFTDSIRYSLLQRLNDTQEKITALYQQHQWHYQGETTLPETYYLAIEGRNAWKDLNKNTQLAFQKIRAFASSENISTTHENFIVYPAMNDSIVQWRASVEVDRFYRTKAKEIKCRRFKGGKALLLVHQGTEKLLKDSWKILKDSLGNKTQTYPLIQMVNKKNDSITNPLLWTTQLYLPIL